jgi:hypothetical protein
MSATEKEREKGRERKGMRVVVKVTCCSGMSSFN